MARSPCDRRLRLHLVGALDGWMPSPEVIGDLALPGSLLEMLGLFGHRLRLQIAVTVDLARRDRSQRRVDRFGIELSSGEGELGVVEQPLRRVVLPALPGL